jgi:hypothetical protein
MPRADLGAVAGSGCRHHAELAVVLLHGALGRVLRGHLLVVGKGRAIIIGGREEKRMRDERFA